MRSSFFESCFTLPKSTGHTFLRFREHSQQKLMFASKGECAGVLWENLAVRRAGWRETRDPSHSHGAWTYSRVIIVVMRSDLSSARNALDNAKEEGGDNISASHKVWLQENVCLCTLKADRCSVFYSWISCWDTFFLVTWNCSPLKLLVFFISSQRKHNIYYLCGGYAFCRETHRNSIKFSLSAFQ